MSIKIFKVILYLNFPKFEKITIFDQDYWLRKIVFKKEKKIITIPAPPNIPIFLSLKFTLFLLSNLDKIRHIKSNSFFKRIYYYYIFSILDYSKTKIIVTYIDNSGIFSNLNKYDISKKRKYFAIQNGARHIPCVKTNLPKGYKITLDNFFCFGKREIFLFKKYSHKIKNFYPIGNIKSSFFYNKNLNVKKKFDICFVSQWQPKFEQNNFKDKVERRVSKEHKESINILVQFLKRLSLKNKYKIIICLRTAKKEEKDYYNSQFKDTNFVLTVGNPKKFTTFKTILKSKLTIALNSTTLTEIFGISKVLWVNILNNKNFQMPEAGISYYNKNNFFNFKNRVEYLLNLKLVNYKKIIKNNVNYISPKNFNRPPRLEIRKKIKEELSNFKNEY
jgi:hypothetical protein